MNNSDKAVKAANLKDKAQRFGCELTDEQVVFLIAEVEKEWVFNSFMEDMKEKGLEFVNERTKESIFKDFDRLIFDTANKDISFDDLLNSLITYENGEIIRDLFNPEFIKTNQKLNRLEIYDANGVDISKILPPCGNIDNSGKNNPFDKESWNMAMQSKIYKENPEIARYLASAAN